MQYILNQEEYVTLRNKADAAGKLPDKESLQKFCTVVADKMPVKRPWNDGPGLAERPWGCILTSQTEYCDICPAKAICPNEFKEWSK
jgi:hypothetical protein